MAHLVSTNLVLLEQAGRAEGLNPARLQFRPLKNPASGAHCAAWHWDLVGPWVPPRRRDSAA
jgi:hypothetical protein